MKLYLILGALLMSTAAYLQNVVVENPEHKKVLYRGYANKLLLGQVSAEAVSYELVPVNCEVALLDEVTRLYQVKINSSAKTAQLNFVADGVVIDSAVFLVKNLPIPSVFWGERESGEKASMANQLTVKYNESVPFMLDFKVLHWKCQLGDKIFEGKGSELPQNMLDHLATVDSGTKVVIKVKFENNGGVARTIVGNWVKG